MNLSNTKVLSVASIKYQIGWFVLYVWCHGTNSSSDHDYDLQPTSLEDKLSAAHAVIEHLQYEKEQLTASNFRLDSISQYAETVTSYTGFTNYMFLRLLLMLYNQQRWVWHDEVTGQMNLCACVSYSLWACVITDKV